MSPTGRAIFLILCLGLPGLAVSSCADPQAFLPKPYRPADKGQNLGPALVLSDHIVVPPVRGLDDERAVLITSRVIDALLDADFIATATSPAQKTSRLYGQYNKAKDGTASIHWTFHDPWGQTVDDFVLALDTDITLLTGDALAARLLADDIAVQAAARLATRAPTQPLATPDTRPLLAPPAPVASPASAEDTPATRHPAASRASILVTAIFDAPKDGALPLKRNIENALRERGFVIVRRPSSETFRLQGTVGLTESSQGFQRLALSWELKSPEDKILATIDQSNEIPASSLAEGWTDLAPLVTQGAATGISNYFDGRAIED